MACKDYCIYKHTAPNGKIYIGITKQSPNKRWSNGHGYKSCRYFFNAILKYGWINIKHEIICYDLPLEEANRLEKFYIEKYRSNDRQFGYNLLEGGGTGEFPEETKQHMRSIKRGNNKGKPVLVYNLNNQYIGEFVSSYQAAKVLKCDQGHIRRCCQGKEGRKQHNGYIFKYKEEIS